MDNKKTNITNGKCVDENVSENKIKLDLVLRSARMGAWQFNIVENKRYFDNQTCALLGIDPATFSGTPEEFYAVVHPDDREMLKASLAHTIDSSVLYEPEYRVIWHDGSIHNITARAELIRDDKSKSEIINGVIWDITERKKSDEILKEKVEKLEVMNKIMVGREIKMVELKKEIADLKESAEKGV